MIDENYVPDFSGDDFENDKEIQESRAAMRAYEEMVEDSFAVLQSELNVKRGSHKNMKHFIMFRSHEPTITASFTAVNPNIPIHISLAAYSSAFPTAKSANSGEDQYLFGYFKTKVSYPKTYIHKETIKEKIVDFVLKREVDFSHSKKFSRKFHVLSEDREKLKEMFLLKDLDILTRYPEMELELNGSECLYRNSRRPISVKEAESFSMLSKTLLPIFS